MLFFFAWSTGGSVEDLERSGGGYHLGRRVTGAVGELCDGPESGDAEAPAQPLAATQRVGRRVEEEGRFGAETVRLLPLGGDEVVQSLGNSRDGIHRG